MAQEMTMITGIQFNGPDGPVAFGSVTALDAAFRPCSFFVRLDVNGFASASIPNDVAALRVADRNGLVLAIVAV